jgi:DNA-binding NarL/FixJ family response regulator
VSEIRPQATSCRHPSIRVLTAEDDSLVRTVIRAALTADAEIEVCAEASNGCEAVELAEREHPDVIILDGVMPELGGIEAARQIIARQPEAKIVILATLEDVELALLGLRAGACGYLMKGADLDALPRVCRAALAGEAAISRTLTRLLLERFSGVPSVPLSVDPPPSVDPLLQGAQQMADLLVAARRSDVNLRKGRRFAARSSFAASAFATRLSKPG